MENKLIIELKLENCNDEAQEVSFFTDSYGDGKADLIGISIKDENKEVEFGNCSIFHLNKIQCEHLISFLTIIYKNMKD